MIGRMIFDGMMTAIAIMKVQAEHEQEWQELIVMAEIMSPELFRETVDRIEAQREMKRKEAQDERRHKEILDAIRSTSFWRFGA